jgi:hypothetical protein
MSKLSWGFAAEAARAAAASVGGGAAATVLQAEAKAIPAKWHMRSDFMSALPAMSLASIQSNSYSAPSAYEFADSFILRLSCLARLSVFILIRKL